MFCCLQSSDEGDSSCSALQSPDESDGSATDTSQGGERQSDEDSAAEDGNSEESEEERSQDDNEAAGLFVRLAKDECKNLQARESLLLGTLKRAKSDRWSELCSGVVVSDE